MNNLCCSQELHGFPRLSAPKGKVKSLPLNPSPPGDELDAMPVVPSAEHSPLMADVERGED